MTILEQLAASHSPLLRDLIGERAPAAPEPLTNKFDNRPTWDNTGGSFDNRPSWDNWSKR